MLSWRVFSSQVLFSYCCFFLAGAFFAAAFLVGAFFADAFFFFTSAFLAAAFFSRCFFSLLLFSLRVLFLLLLFSSAGAFLNSFFSLPCSVSFVFEHLLSQNLRVACVSSAIGCVNALISRMAPALILHEIYAHSRGDLQRSRVRPWQHCSMPVFHSQYTPDALQPLHSLHHLKKTGFQSAE